MAYLREWCDVIEGLMSEAAQTPTDLDSIQVALASLKCLSSFFVSKCQAIEKIAFPCLRVTVQKCLEVQRFTSKIMSQALACMTHGVS